MLSKEDLYEIYEKKQFAVKLTNNNEFLDVRACCVSVPGLWRATKFNTREEAEYHRNKVAERFSDKGRRWEVIEVTFAECHYSFFGN